MPIYRASPDEASPGVMPLNRLFMFCVCVCVPSPSADFIPALGARKEVPWNDLTGKGRVESREESPQPVRLGSHGAGTVTNRNVEGHGGQVSARLRTRFISYGLVDVYMLVRLLIVHFSWTDSRGQTHWLIFPLFPLLPSKSFPVNCVKNACSSQIIQTVNCKYFINETCPLALSKDDLLFIWKAELQ